jgi:glycerol-3-phosphate dehydrogenase (NAD(P)+)
MKIAVLGDGGWGTALAILLSEKGNDVFLWSNFPEYADILNKKRENIKFLPGVAVPETIKIGSDISLALEDAEFVMLAVPSKYMRDICKKVKISKQTKCVLSVAKGLEIGSLKRMSEVIGEEIPDVPVAVLSGPSHAEEVGKKLPTAVVVASKDIKMAEYVQNIFMGDRFRVYTTNDVVGVEIGGSLKNVIAIAVGVCDGLGLGDNSRTALMTRGLAEIARLGVTMGARRETFTGLSGMGDIIVTCISKYGRNLRFGHMLAEGKTVQSALSSTEMVFEGVTTANAAYELGQKCNVEMPITNEVYQVIYKEKPYKQAIQDLMKRAPKQEMEW